MLLTAAATTIVLNVPAEDCHVGTCDAQEAAVRYALHRCVEKGGRRAVRVQVDHVVLPAPCNNCGMISSVLGLEFE